MILSVLKFSRNILLILLLISCQKDDENVNNNPTNGLTTAVFNSNLSYGSMTDQDGNVYKTIKIGNQSWMAENLRTTKYNDGSNIYEAKSNTDFISNLNDDPFGSGGGCCVYNFSTNLTEIATYGRLYSFNAVNTGKLAPKGWRIALTSDFEELSLRLGGYQVAANKMKEEGTSHWNTYNAQVTNEWGFTALPSGLWDRDLGFNGKGVTATYWADYDVLIWLWSGDSILSTEGSLHNQLYSVRCVKVE